MSNRVAALLLLACAVLGGGTASLAQNADAYAVADAASGRVFDSRRANSRVPIASLTKIAAAIVVLDWLELNRRDPGTLAVISESALEQAGQNPIGFQPGDRASVRDLLYAMLVQSDNIAAWALAEHVGRDLQRNQQSEHRPADLFVAQMNALARKLDLRNTRFLNPHGLDRKERPYSTARDLVKLSIAAMQKPHFRFYVSQKERVITIHTADGRTAGYRLANTNALLGRLGVDGVKTGTSTRAGECLVVSSLRPPESVQHADGTYTVTPRRLIVVILGSTDRFGDAQILLNKGWELHDDWVARGRPLKK